MMRNIFKLVLFSLLLNIATGIMSVAIIDSNGNNVFQSQDMGRLPQYDSQSTTSTFTNFNSSVDPAGIAEDKGNIVFRLLDLISLGFIGKIITLLDTYLYGFINLANSMFGSFMAPALHDLLFGSYYFPMGILKIIITIGYILGVFELWTNKTIID
jgi:hypothetical protein